MSGCSLYKEGIIYYFRIGFSYQTHQYKRKFIFLKDLSLLMFVTDYFCYLKEKNKKNTGV